MKMEAAVRQIKFPTYEANDFLPFIGVDSDNETYYATG
jgi:hypothetical protein